MKIKVPWQIHMPALKSRTPGSGNWWNRKHFKDKRSVPQRSVLMEGDDLDHLGTFHKTTAHRNGR